MNKSSILKIALFMFVCTASHSVYADKKEKNTDATGDVTSVIEGAIAEVVDEVIGSTVSKAKDVVREHTGIDLDRSGYTTGQKHKPLPACASDRAKQQLGQLRNEYDGEISKLEQELRRVLAEAELEFEREASRENKAEKVYKKKEKLQKKANKAYKMFDEKVNKQNKKFDEKRVNIVSKERGSEHCKNARDDNGMGKDNKEKHKEKNKGNKGKDRDDDDEDDDDDDDDKKSDNAPEKKSWWKFWE